VVASLRAYEGTVIVVSHSREFPESVPLTHTLQLNAGGLVEIESIDEFVGDVEGEVATVIAKWGI